MQDFIQKHQALLRVASDYGDYVNSIGIQEKE